MRYAVEPGVYSTSLRDDLVLNHPVMQRQREHKQLGQVEAVHVGATHTRFDHLGLSTIIGHELCDSLEGRGRLPGARADIIRFIQMHDVGHPPFSHALEYLLAPLTGTDHKQRALILLADPQKDKMGRTLRDTLESAGVDVDTIIQMFNGQHPGAAVCSDKTLGADKLAYTLMDAQRCDFDQLPPDWQRLVPYVTCLGGKLGIDIRNDSIHSDSPIARVAAMQQFYFRMYTEVYLSPRSLAYERHIQRAVEHAIKAGIYEARDVWDFPDSALLHDIARSNTDDIRVRIAKEEARRYIERDPLEPAVALKYDEFKIDRLSNESVYVISSDFASKFLKTFANPLRLTELEGELSAELKTPLMVSVLPDPEKVKPSDVLLYRNGSLETTLETLRPHHFAEMRERARQFFAVRVLVPSSEQHRVARAATDVGSLLEERARTYFTRA